MDNLLHIFGNIADPRVQGRCLHHLSDLLVISLLCIIANGEDFEDMEEYGHQNKAFLSTFLSLPHGIPSHDTFRRVFGILDTKAVLSLLTEHSASLLSCLQEKQVCIDGKKLRGATPKASPESGIYLLSAWVAENGLCVAQERVGEKSNEITALPEILDSLELTDTLVSIDAMGCQKSVAKQIVQKKGHYLLALKENQGTLYQDVKYAFQTATPIATATHIEQGTKADKRICTILDATTCLSEAQRKAWENINRLIRIESSRTVAGVTNWTTRYYIADEQVDNPTYFQYAVRDHWSIENKCHWFLDVVFREDEARVRKDNAPENLATIRKIALQMLRNEKTKMSLPKKRYRASMNNEFLKKVLTF